jgi:hypothetical protein
MVEKKLKEQFLKGIFNDLDNRPEWAMYWINDLITNIKAADNNNFLINEVKESWFNDFWEHYQECKVFVEMVDEQDDLDNLDLSQLNNFPQ